MELVKEVCKEEGLSFEMIGGHGNMAEVVYLGKPYVFSYAATPFNREDVQRVCCDKFLAHSLLSSKINMPKTLQYLRPDLDAEVHGEIIFSSQEEIVANILENFEFPFIVKMNAGSLGRNVFKCKTIEEVGRSVAKIFKEDWALLAQELVIRDQEFRVMIVGNGVEMIYHKGGGEFFTPDSEIFEKVKSFLAPLSKAINLGWAGLDVMLDASGRLWLIELNTKPSIVSAMKAGKKEELKQLYKKAFGGILGVIS